MPLRDHSREPLASEIGDVPFLMGWMAMLVQRLNLHVLPADHRALPESERREDGVRDTFEIRVLDGRRRLVGAIELVGEENVASLAARRTFALRCAGHLQNGACVCVVDVVARRRTDLLSEILEAWVGDDADPPPTTPRLAVSLRPYADDGFYGEICPEPVGLGAPLPALRLWLPGDLVVPVELEETYEQACKVLRIA